VSLPDDAGHQPLSAGMARCYRHPMRETGVRCIRCNRPICPECMRPASVGFQCPDDVKIAARTVRQPRTVVGAPLVAQAYVTWSLIAVNIAVYLVMAADSKGGLTNPTRSTKFLQWALEPVDVATKHQFARLITSAFVHLSLTHILLNMLALGFIGPFLERALGWWRYLALYLLAALGGSLLVYAIGAHFGAVAGASGAIYGLFAAALVLGRRMQLDLRSLLVTVGVNFVFTFSIPGISIEGHIGGFVAGGLAALAVVGWPDHQRRVATVVQAAGLVGLAAVMVIAVAVRTVTF
jgi:membrane associated rhomboid family serine protease